MGGDADLYADIPRLANHLVNVDTAVAHTCSNHGMRVRASVFNEEMIIPEFLHVGQSLPPPAVIAMTAPNPYLLCNDGS